MQIGKLTVLALSFVLPLATAAPAEENMKQGSVDDLEVVEVIEARDFLDTRAARTLKVCQNFDLKGPCKTWSIPDNTCFHIGKEYNDKVSSFEVKGGMYCRLYRHTSCKGGAYGSNGRVTWLSGDWNDKFSSFRCSW